MMVEAKKALCRAIIRFQLAVAKFEQEERGDAVQAIIMIAIGVILAVILYKFLLGSGAKDMENGTYDEKNSGVVGKIFHQIDEKIKTMFG